MPKQTVCFISDTHNTTHWQADKADVLIHCGDLTNHGSPLELYEGFAWLSGHPHKHVAYLPGNHDFGMEHEPMRELMQHAFPRVQLLEPGMNVVGDLIVAAAPWMNLEGWGFYAPSPYIKQCVEQMLMANAEVDLLVSHDPPNGHLDLVEPRVSSRGFQRPGGNVGQLWYRELARRLGTKLHAFGHIHECGGECETDEHGVEYINAAVLKRDYHTPIHTGIVRSVG